jgi:hypothetical protein
VRITADGETVVLERLGETSWRMVEPRREDASVAKVEDVLYTLRGLRWTRIVAADGGQAGTYGLDTPATEITLLEKDGAELAKLAVGTGEGGQLHVRTGAGPAVYAVDAKGLDDLPRRPDDFKDS